jgi:hypothetical protein
MEDAEIMKTQFMGLLIFAGLALTCSKPHESARWIRVPWFSESVTIPNTIEFGRAIEFEVKSWAGNACWSYSHLEITSHRFDVYVKPFAKRDSRQIVCFAVIVHFDMPGYFTPLLPGDYRFHFWQSDTTSFDTTVTVH